MFFNYKKIKFSRNLKSLKVLYDELKIPRKVNNTEEKTLAEMSHPIASVILSNFFNLNLFI